uniref:Mpv17-like protein n=1 Tax=Bracon brevicornis TaxID=1563983 RepID=A0A6V7J3G7_9HYME
MGVCVWPILQTINFTLIPERNRVVYVSICSLVWTSFLAYMKSLDAQRLEEERLLTESSNTPVPSLPPVNVNNETVNVKNNTATTTVNAETTKITNEPPVKNDNATVQLPKSTAKTKVP